MATLTVQEITRVGTAVTPVAAGAGGDKMAPSDDSFLIVVNGGGGAITVTVATPGTALTDVGIADLSVSVGAGLTRYIGPLPYAYFANPTDGLCDITYSGVTTVTVAAVRLKKP